MGGGSFSLEEKVVGTWIDGKPIYRRVIDCGTKTINNTTWTFLCEFDDVDTPISFSVLRSEGSSYKDVLGMDNAFNSTFLRQGVELMFKAPSYTGGFIVIVSYTKTTD